jgi:hypothetical protein
MPNFIAIFLQSQVAPREAISEVARTGQNLRTQVIGLFGPIR